MRSTTLRRRFYVETCLGIAGLVLFALTLVWKDWIELVFRVDPDAGNGSVEFLVAAVLLSVAALSGWLARTEWRRVRSPAASSTSHG